MELIVHYYDYYQCKS